MFEPKYIPAAEYEAILIEALTLAERKALEHYLNSLLDGNTAHQREHRQAADQMHANIRALEERLSRWRSRAAGPEAPE
jgi:septal ring factor EnvC (AmiA/AmiB activator)